MSTFFYIACKHGDAYVFGPQVGGRYGGNRWVPEPDSDPNPFITEHIESCGEAALHIVPEYVDRAPGEAKPRRGNRGLDLGRVALEQPARL